MRWKLDTEPPLVAIREWLKTLSAPIAAVSVLVALFGLGISEHSVRVSNRPWVGVQSVAVAHPADVHSPVRATVTIKNYGRSPAIDVQATVLSEAISASEQQTRFSHDETDPLFMIPPDSTYSLTTAAPSQERYDGVVAGTHTLWIRGIVDYADTFGDSHHMDFQFLYDPGTRSFAAYGPNTGD